LSSIGLTQVPQVLAQLSAIHFDSGAIGDVQKDSDVVQIVTGAKSIGLQTTFGQTSQVFLQNF